MRNPTSPKPCDSCGKVIDKPFHYQRFCSQACKQRDIRTRRKSGATPPPRYTKQKGRAGTTQEAVCSRCGESFWYTFVQRVRTVCDLCRTHDSDWAKFRLTGAQAEKLRADARCAICGGDHPGGRFGNWHIDHDHNSGAVRGVLCSWCNTALGLLGDDPERMDRAAEYLRNHTRLSNKRPV